MKNVQKVIAPGLFAMIAAACGGESPAPVPEARRTITVQGSPSGSATSSASPPNGMSLASTAWHCEVATECCKTLATRGKADAGRCDQIKSFAEKDCRKAYEEFDKVAREIGAPSCERLAVQSPAAVTADSQTLLNLEGAVIATGEDPACHAKCDAAHAGSAGACGNCGAHCVGGTEAECTENCNRTYGPWDDGPCHYDCDHGRKEACYRGCNGNKSCEGWCGKDWLPGCHASCSGVKTDRENRRQGCLNACGGFKGCRNSWCDGAAPEKAACYRRADQEYQSCLISCRPPPENPKDLKASCSCIDPTGRPYTHRAHSCPGSINECCPCAGSVNCPRFVGCSQQNP